jgi:hypothetical protein
MVPQRLFSCGDLSVLRRKERHGEGIARVHAFEGGS